MALHVVRADPLAQHSAIWCSMWVEERNAVGAYINNPRSIFRFDRSLISGNAWVISLDQNRIHVHQNLRPEHLSGLINLTHGLLIEGSTP